MKLFVAFPSSTIPSSPLFLIVLLSISLFLPAPPLLTFIVADCLRFLTSTPSMSATFAV